MIGVDALPAKSTFAPGEDVILLLDTPSADRVRATISHLGSPVRKVRGRALAGRTPLSLGEFREGSYAVRVTSDASGEVTTAFDVLSHPARRPRYGFVTDFAAARADTTDVADSWRAFHLNAIQFYDWMHGHADLLPPADDFVDALGRELSLATVRELVAAAHDAGGLAIAYAAVYAAGREYAEAHPDQVLHHRGGEPWQLGDFLWIMDIARGSAWTRHVVAQMRDAVARVGFDGLHLDQYGDPKLAVSAAGGVVDLADGFAAIIEAARDALPDTTLIFNNVNDFPTWATTPAPQDVTYVEVWSPNDDYDDLVRLVDTARSLAPARPVVLAAYLEPFAAGSGDAELAAAKLALATVWACGGQYLLFGERHGVLTHPYYPNFATLADNAVQTLRRFADFAVANGDVLMDPAYWPATRQLWGGVNADVLVDGAPMSADPEAGCLWIRVSRHGRRLVLQMVDLLAQDDSRWNAPKRPTAALSGLVVRVRVASRAPTVCFGHPARGPELNPLDYVDEGEYIQLSVPDFDTWALLVVDC